MPYHFIPHAVKISAMKLHECELLDLDTILDVMEMSCSTFFHVQKLWHETGDVISPRPAFKGVSEPSTMVIYSIC
jgi:hypothetical protein